MRVVDQRIKYPVPSRSGSCKVKSVSHCQIGQHSREKTCFEESVCSIPGHPEAWGVEVAIEQNHLELEEASEDPDLERQILREVNRPAHRNYFTMSDDQHLNPRPAFLSSALPNSLQLPFCCYFKPQSSEILR